MQITVENIKCGGCANSITKALQKEFGNVGVTIDVEHGVIDIDTSNEEYSKAKEVLKGIGYPEIGKNSFTSKARSFASCAIGKLDKA